MKTLIIALILAGDALSGLRWWYQQNGSEQQPSPATLDGTLYDVSGEKGTVICLHGAGQKGIWGQEGTGQNEFIKSMRAKGYSYVCPPAAGSTWDKTDGLSNPDIQTIDGIVAAVGARPPYYLVGHSDGGTMVTRYAIWGKYKPAVVQYSNPVSETACLQSPEYQVPSIFCYSSQDPVIDYSAVIVAIGVLLEKGVAVAQRDLHRLYERHEDLYDHEHEFVNTATYTARRFQRMTNQ